MTVDIPTALRIASLMNCLLGTALGNWKQSLRTGSYVKSFSFWFWAYVVAVQGAKFFNIFFCECHDMSQPFNLWFYSTFQHPPWSHWVSYYFFGKEYVYLAAPYSPLWYLFHWPATFGYWPIAFYLFGIDNLFLAVLGKFHHKLYLLAYLETTKYFLPVDPIDLLPFWFILLGRVRLPFLVIAPLMKLPVGAPAYVWNFVLYSPNSVQDSINWGRYFILGGWWITALVLNMRDRIE